MPSLRYWNSLNFVTFISLGLSCIALQLFSMWLGLVRSMAVVRMIVWAPLTYKNAQTYIGNRQETISAFDAEYDFPFARSLYFGRSSEV